MNRNPLKNEELDVLCQYFNIGKKDFLNLFKLDLVKTIAEGRSAHEISKLRDLKQDEQVRRTIEIQNNSSNIQRDIKLELFIQLILACNFQESSVIQSFLLSFPNVLKKITNN